MVLASTKSDLDNNNNNCRQRVCQMPFIYYSVEGEYFSTYVAAIDWLIRIIIMCHGPKQKNSGLLIKPFIVQRKIATDVC